MAVVVLFLGVEACSSSSPSATNGGTGGQPTATGGAGTAGTGGAAEMGGATGMGGAAGMGGAGGFGAHCTADDDCGQTFFCYAPGVFHCSGKCPVGSTACATDADCAPDAGSAAPSVCVDVPCGCSPSRACQPGCLTSADCEEGMTCGADHHCTRTVCSPSVGGCPANFACSEGLCIRQSCGTDADCAGGCVANKCYSAAGICQLAPY